MSVVGCRRAGPRVRGFAMPLMVLIIGVLMMLCAPRAQAHQAGNSYLRITHEAQALTVQIEFPVRDLDVLLQIPENERQPYTSDRLAIVRTPLARVIATSLQLEVDGVPVVFTFTAQDVALRNDGLYVRQTHVAPALPPNVAYLRVAYGFFNEEEKIARAFVRLNANGQESTAVLDARHAVQRLPLREVALFDDLRTYAREGALHIWSGPDHLLFLLCLLLPGLALAAQSRRALVLYALKVVTAFTVAHSLTLAAAALNLIALPDTLIEATIAASIMVAALLNLWGVRQHHSWKLAFGFGLIHGMGFANGLRELGLSSARFIEMLLAFNLGVEFGQMAVVLAAGLLTLPLLRNPLAIARLQRWGSIAILLMALVWLVERLA